MSTTASRAPETRSWKWYGGEAPGWTKRLVMFGAGKLDATAEGERRALGRSCQRLPLDQSVQGVASSPRPGAAWLVLAFHREQLGRPDPHGDEHARCHGSVERGRGSWARWCQRRPLLILLKSSWSMASGALGVVRVRVQRLIRRRRPPEPRCRDRHPEALGESRAARRNQVLMACTGTSGWRMSAATWPAGGDGSRRTTRSSIEISTCTGSTRTEAATVAADSR